MHLEVHEVVLSAFHVHNDPHVPRVQQWAHGEVQKVYAAHQIDQHEQKDVLDALKSAISSSGCCPCTP
jgi:hypothetical protein